MAKETEAVALGIGVQTDQATVNAAVRDAVALGTAAATGTTATGILLRDPEDLSKSFERQESDGGQVPGSLSRLSGTLESIEPTVSFTIDARGNGVATTTPIAGEFTFDEYFERILAGAGLTRGVEDAAFTPYNLGPVAEYQTLKIWRGTESWTLVGCRFNLTWNLEAGEKSTISVEVIADSVIYLVSDTFPPEAPAIAYGTQVDGAPILRLAQNALNSITRGFISGTLAVGHTSADEGDVNAATGKVKVETERSIDWSADYYKDTLETTGDFVGLQNNLDAASASPLYPMTFNLGQAAGAGDIQNAMSFDIPNLRMTGTDKVDAANEVVRTISGYAAIAGDSGVGFAAEQEFELRGI